ncbi:DUF6221 family protein [Micromonospora sp. NPDC049366]|uniref:DUF6221 family protein n=1 Tax=Micromonospora sp. NPDC049366 TaxID=3364271 RepID=UPI0037BC248A
MDDLIIWLRAQLDEDERIARASLSAFGVADTDQTPVWPDHVTYGGAVELNAAEAYLDTFRPHRVLAEVDAKRRIVDNCAWVLKGEACLTLRLLALPFADRPGYRDEWRP